MTTRAIPEAHALRLDHHFLCHLIAKANGREVIELADNRLAEILLSEMKAAGVDVMWEGPGPNHYPVSVRAALAAPSEPS